MEQLINELSKYGELRINKLPRATQGKDDYSVALVFNNKLFQNISGFSKDEILELIPYGHVTKNRDGEFQVFKLYSKGDLEQALIRIQKEIDYLRKRVGIIEMILTAFYKSKTREGGNHE